jgi:hypothetical protein
MQIADRLMPAGTGMTGSCRMSQIGGDLSLHVRTLESHHPVGRPGGSAPGCH